MKILTEIEKRKAVATGKIDKSVLTPSQQERLVRGIQSSIDALVKAVSGISISGVDLSATTTAINKLRETIAGLPTKPDTKGWTFTIQRDSERRIMSIKATKG